MPVSDALATTLVDAIKSILIAAIPTAAVVWARHESRKDTAETRESVEQVHELVDGTKKEVVNRVEQVHQLVDGNTTDLKKEVIRGNEQIAKLRDALDQNTPDGVTSHDLVPAVPVPAPTNDHTALPEIKP